MEPSNVIIAKSTRRRLPLYYNLLQQRIAAGDMNVSSSYIANALNLNPVLVRKDLASVSKLPGRPKLGFKTEDLLEDIGNYLGYNKIQEAIVVGVGGLGHALLMYEGFNDYGLRVVAGFDINPALHQGNTSKPILATSDLCDFVAKNNIKVGIITTPKQAAQSVANLLVKAGIRAIWNFAPSYIDVPKNVLVKSQNLAASLAVLTQELDEVIEREKGNNGK